MSMKNIILSLMVCVFAVSLIASEAECPAKKSCCDKSKSECPAKKPCGDKAKDGKGGCPMEKKDTKDKKS